MARHEEGRARRREGGMGGIGRGVAALTLMLAAGAARACIIENEDVALTGEVHAGWFGWTFEADEARCLAALLDEPTRDGLAWFSYLPGEWRVWKLAWGEVAPMAGRVRIEGFVISQPSARAFPGTFVEDGPPFVIHVQRVTAE